MNPRLFLLLFLVPAARAQCSLHPCVLNCTDCNPGDYVLDPKDCTRYYICGLGGGLMMDESFPCPDGEVFSTITHTCHAGSTCKSCPSSCTYDCNFPNLNDVISSSYDCGTYQDCLSGVPGLSHTCPSSAPYFDGIGCQTDQSRCCHCHPYCYQGDQGLYVPDPTDCRRYYLCPDETMVPDSVLSCPSGENFDPQQKACSATAVCVTQCKNVVGEDGCIDPYMCEAAGLFPRCPGQCTPEYYRCTGVSNEYIEAGSCPSGYVFHPNTLLCVTEDQCPY